MAAKYTEEQLNSVEKPFSYPAFFTAAGTIGSHNKGASRIK